MMRRVLKQNGQSISERFGADDLEATVEAIESSLDEAERRKLEFVPPGWAEYFGPTLERLQDARRRQIEQTPEGRRILDLGQRVWKAGVLMPKKASELRQATLELLQCVGGGGLHAIDDALERLEQTKKLERQSWPKADHWDGAIANPGRMLELMDRVAEIIRGIDVSNLKPRPTVPEHPLADAGGFSIDD
ncbi:MAG TPA: hypothetical protein VNM15_05220 [Candidatus Binatia bacterium]|nr:hypothetical protein [Candidatus Binatia bacterium]